jgi:hypothetical protein
VSATWVYLIEHTHQKADKFSRQIHSKTTVELPFWLATPLAASDRDFITLALPKCYSSRVRAALAASAPSVQLRGLGGSMGHFFDMGNRLETWSVVILLRPPAVSLNSYPPSRIDDPKLRETLFIAFRARLPEVLDQSGHEAEGEAADFVGGLDEWERERESPRPERSFYAERKADTCKSVRGWTEIPKRYEGLVGSAYAQTWKGDTID